MISKDNKAFCILPFVHTHLNTEGDVFPCCISWDPTRSTQIGFLKDNTLEEIFNSDVMKQLRIDFVNGVRRPDFCTACYQREDNGFVSGRHGSNLDYLDVEDEIVAKMEEDGYLEPIIKSWDIRFSNLCNLKCRSCGSVYSTTWAQEDEKFDGYSEYKSLKSIPDGAADPLENQYDNVDKIYFAGGEPLIMPEHFHSLQKIIDTGRAGKVKLLYNTNMTKLNYNKHNLIELWKHFKIVVIGASIDAMGERAEYIRNGVKWSVIENNFKELSEAVKVYKNINIHISPTVSIMNVHSLPDLHKYFVEKGYVENTTAIVLNMLLHPAHYEIRNLPENLKTEVKQKIKDHCVWLREQDTRLDVIESFESILTYIENPSSNEDVARFVSETNRIDKRRNQSFGKTFPEYADWWDSINGTFITVENI